MRIPLDVPTHELTHDHVAWVLAEGARRQGRGLTDTAKPVTDRREALIRRVNGCGGELAVANKMHVTWPARLKGVPDFPKQGWEVKTRDVHHFGDNGTGGDLALRPHEWAGDDLHPFYWLVWGCMPFFHVVGYLRGADVMAALGPTRGNYGLRYVPWGAMTQLPCNGGPPWPHAAKAR